MRVNSNRLQQGGRIDRSVPVQFNFNGKDYKGYKGDTLASALLANGITLTARSFKYHRPRGIVGSWIEEPCSFVELLGDDQSANQPITTVTLKEGLVAKSVNCWPTPAFDVLSVNQLFSRLLPAAFYYKTFKWPDWHWFEPSIRRAAGLAKVPQLPQTTDIYENRFAHCDVLVVGAGPAGLMSALCAARSGVRVILVDDRSEAGGSLLNTRHKVDGQLAPAWIASVINELSSNESVTVLQNATAWGYREHNLVLITEHEPELESISKRSWRVRAKCVVVATGAIERNLVFTNNDRPGVMLCSAVSNYVNQYAVRPGQQLVVFTNNSSTYQTTAELLAAGLSIVAIVDSRSRVSEDERALVTGVEILVAHEIVKAHGRARIHAVTVRAKTGESTKKIECDLLCVSGGWSPAVHLYSQARGRLIFDDNLAALVPDNQTKSTICMGAAAGVFNLPDIISSCVHKTCDLLYGLTGQQLGQLPLSSTSDLPFDISPLWFVEQTKHSDKAFVDLQNDVTVSDIQLSIREGFGAVEHVKRYTTAGMGLDQGRTGNVNTMGVIASQTNASMDEVGATTFRAPFIPIEFGAIGGLREESALLPYRHTPVTLWNQNNGACMYESGARWQRPGYYPLAGETFQESVNREASAVRNAVAVYDGSPLGKFDIKGPDAEKLLNLLYTNSFSELDDGSGRYGIMLTDDGLILDDGIAFRLAENHYLMSTSTGNADTVYRHMEHLLQIQRPEWSVNITPVTSQWCNATVCGPLARDVMTALKCSIDLSPQAFPFMSIRSGTVAELAVRVCRVSFTGELSYEINIAARDFLTLWERIISAGKPFGLIPIGSEANHVLRAEKGFLSLGHEADGTTDPIDLGMGWILSTKKPDFLGKRAIQIRRKLDKPRRELVGLLTDNPGQMIPEGAPLTPNAETRPSEGLVTASVWSVVNQRVVSLALLNDGRNRLGETVYIRVKKVVIKATVTNPCFYDPTGNVLRS